MVSRPLQRELFPIAAPAPLEYVADLHVHSRFSRATSREADLAHLWIAAQRKGVRVVGTGDFTHPGWFSELERELVPAEEGLFALRSALSRALADAVPAACAAPVRFMLTTEISNIYKRDGRTRKIHNLACLPDLASVATLNRALARIGNITSDGRPILGLDSRDLLELVLGASPHAVLIPAHIWTPWFSVLGSRSGFDTVDACYRDLASHVFAVETGLSSDPPMNWRLSALDRYALVSNSDAHSPSKLAREANLFSGEPSYGAIFDALRRRDRRSFHGTLEFFPEEGKYHLDGHRRCHVRLTPAQTRELGGRCPACGKPLTLGVLYRVEELADLVDGRRPAGAAPFVSLVGLSRILGEVLGVGPDSQGVLQSAEALLRRLGPELQILRAVPLEELRAVGGALLAEAVRRMRDGEVQIEGGYDGEFGRVRLLAEGERREIGGQTTLFAPGPRRVRRTTGSAALVPRTDGSDDARGPAEIEEQETLEDSARPSSAAASTNLLPSLELEEGPPDPLAGLSAAQRAAASHRGSPVIIVAGPGTGKTRTLTQRIAYRLRCGHDPATIVALTFTTRAAGEMRARLRELLGAELAGAIPVCTFHALALAVLNDGRRLRGLSPLVVIDEEERRRLLLELLPGAGERQRARAALELGLARLAGEGGGELGERYARVITAREVEDLDGLVHGAVVELRASPEMLAHWRRRCATLCVDEYQDINRGQYELVRLLCDGGGDLCVIGDPDQAIYSFRGADSTYFLRFCADYPGAARFTLDRSYRSGAAILEAAHQLIAHDPERLDTRTWSDEPGAPRVVLYRTSTGAAEAELIVHSIERAVGGTTLFSFDSGRSDGSPDEERSFSDFAVLFRTGAQADLLREAFARSGIPFVCAAGRSGAEAIAPLLAFLREEAAGPATTANAEALRAQIRGQPPRAALEQLARTLCAEEDRALGLELVEQLAAQIFGAPTELARWAPLVLGLAASAVEADALARREAVCLLTLHASKGLEFTTVFITGCEAGLLPLLYPGEDQAARLAEERRLLYVGMTRARRALILTCASRREVRGASRPQQPSAFLAELPQELLELRTPDPLPARHRRAQLTLF